MTKPIIFAVAVAVFSGNRQASTVVFKSQQPSAAGRLCGRVLDHETHQPLPGVTIEMQSDNADDDNTVTDDNGAFVFDELEDGRYWLAAHRVDYAPAYVGQESISGRTAGRVLVHGAQPTDVGDIELARGGVIAGHVLDPYGRPAASALVRFQRLAREDPDGPRWSFEGQYGSASIDGTPTGSTRTNVLGEFRVYGLAAGNYILSARGVWPSVVFFPATTEPALAQPIAVVGGTEVADIDIRLAGGKGYSLSGEVQSPLKIDEGTAVELRPRHEYLRPWLFQAAFALNGHYQFNGVPPGSYWVVGRGHRQTEPNVWGVGIVNVVDRDVAGLNIAMEPSVEISGRVVFEGLDRSSIGPHLFSVTLELQECRELPWSTEDENSTRIDRDATFELTELMPGRYRLRVRAGEDGAALEIVSVSIGGQTLSAQDFDVPRGDLSDLVIRVRRR